MSDELRIRETWFSERLQADVTVVRWGAFGVPVLVFPSAGGDAEEIERYGLVNACGPLLAEGRVKLYSVDSVAGRAMVAKDGSAEHRMWLLSQFQECVRWEVVPAIHADLGGRALDIIAAGASIGAFNSVAMLCRYPDVFGAAIGMSGRVPRVRQVGGRAGHPRRPGRRVYGRGDHRRLDRGVQRGGGAVPVSGRVRRGRRDERQLPDRAVLRRSLEPGPVLRRAAAVPARPGGPAARPAPGAAGRARGSCPAWRARTWTGFASGG